MRQDNHLIEELTAQEIQKYLREFVSKPLHRGRKGADSIEEYEELIEEVMEPLVTFTQALNYERGRGHEGFMDEVSENMRKTDIR